MKRAAIVGFAAGILCEQAVTRGYPVFLATLTIGLLTGLVIGVLTFERAHDGP